MPPNVGGRGRGRKDEFDKHDPVEIDRNPANIPESVEPGDNEVGRGRRIGSPSAPSFDSGSGSPDGEKEKHLWLLPSRESRVS